ncbi:MAG: hypothetical protein V4524_02235 [Patescibacteria group bacterium]
MKKYRNILLSFASYLSAFIFAFIVPVMIAGEFPELTSTIALISPLLGLMLPIILILLGIFFASKSIKLKESKWVGHATFLIGMAILVLPIILLIVGFHI